MNNPTLGDVLRVAVEQKLPVMVRWNGTDDQTWYGPKSINREEAAKICMEGAAVRITFFVPENTPPPADKQGL